MRVVGSFVRGLIAFFSIAVAMTLAEALLHQVCDAGTKTPTGLCRSEHAVGLIEDYVREIMAGMAEDDPAREFLHYQYLFQFDQNLEEAANVDNILIPYWDRMMQKSSEEVEKRELPVDPDFDVCCPDGWLCLSSNYVQYSAFCYKPEIHSVLFTEETDQNMNASILNLVTLDYTRGDNGETINIIPPEKGRNKANVNKPDDEVKAQIGVEAFNPVVTTSSNLSTHSSSTMYITNFHTANSTTGSIPTYTMIVNVTAPVGTPTDTTSSGVALRSSMLLTTIISSIVYLAFFL